MTFVAIWRFTTDDRGAFEEHYGPRGTWAQFFRRSPDYLRTDLLRSGEGYLTLDWWRSREAYEAFRTTEASEYAAIDATCEAVTETEEKVGEYDVVS